jgi:hypothetical protein
MRYRLTANFASGGIGFAAATTLWLIGVGLWEQATASGIILTLLCLARAVIYLVHKE